MDVPGRAAPGRAAPGQRQVTIRHVVLFRWREGVGPAEVGELTQRLGELPGRIPELRHYQVGADLGLAEGNWDFCIVADVDDPDAFDRYARHPLHVELVEQGVRPLLADRAAIQYRLA